MAVAIEMNYQGMTLDHYEGIREKLGLAPFGPTPPGALFHWVAEGDGGLRIVDVWESREAFDRYAQEHIAPMSAAVGYEGQPELRFYDVHNYLSAG
jgi:hypothetical protein